MNRVSSRRRANLCAGLSHTLPALTQNHSHLGPLCDQALRCPRLADRQNKLGQRRHQVNDELGRSHVRPWDRAQ